MASDAQITKCYAKNRPFCIGKPCASQCGVIFQKTDAVIVVDEQTSIFRGDDKVLAYCPDCYQREAGDATDSQTQKPTCNDPKIVYPEP